MMDGRDDIQFDLPQRVPTRSKIYLAAGLLVLLGVFLPGLGGKVLDVLWICCFCLSGAAAIVCMSARRSADLIGFAPMLAGLTLLRLVTLAGAAGQVVRDQAAGVLLDVTGSALGSGWPLAALLACLLLAGMSIFVVCFSSGRISAAAGNYLKQVFPLKRTGIETDLRLGVIDDEQARTLAERVAAEGRFFTAMRGAGLLMTAEVFIGLFLLALCLAVPASNETLTQASGAGILAVIAPPVAGLAAFSLIPVTVVSAACGALMSRETLALRGTLKDESDPKQARKITVVTLDTADDQELLNPDFVHHRSHEQIANFEPQPPETGKSGPVSMDISCRNAKEYYEKLSRVIDSITQRPRVILLVSDKVHSLPVTVAVNIAIRLAQKRQRVLLVDTDAQRNAVGKVFDLDIESMRKKVQSSCLEGLAVCCVPAERFGAFLDKKNILDHFDATLIYTPNVSAITAGKVPDRGKPGAFYFVDDENAATAQQAAGKLGFCGWLCVIPSIQSVLEKHS